MPGSVLPLAGAAQGPGDFWNALGLLFQVGCADPTVEARLRLLFHALGEPGAPERRRSAFQIQGDEAVPLAQQLDDLVALITLNALFTAEGNLLLHAGAVARSDGDVAVLCGPSGSGKSTLTVRLVEGGLSYVSDETACMDPLTLRLEPYRKPVSVKPGSQQVLAHLRPEAGADMSGTWLIPPCAIEARPLPPAPLTPGLLVFPTYSPGAGVQVEAITQGHAAFLLGRNCSMLTKVRGGPLPALARLTRRAPAYRIVHDDVEGAARTVRELWAA